MNGGGVLRLFDPFGLGHQRRRSTGSLLWMLRGGRTGALNAQAH
jgi:hypothetical protein